jgi:hypothetical protein
MNITDIPRRIRTVLSATISAALTIISIHNTTSASVGRYADVAIPFTARRSVM